MKGISFVKFLCLLMVGYRIDAALESHQIAVATESSFELLKTLTSGFLPAIHSEEVKMLQRKYKKHLVQGEKILGDVQSLNKKIETKNFALCWVFSIWCFIIMALIAIVVTPKTRNLRIKLA